jgi:hypothetical protein
MNIKSLIITIIVAFLTIGATDFLVHQVWLTKDYAATASLWRPMAEMKAKMPFMFTGQFLAAVAFTMIFAACVAEKRCLSCTMKFAAMMGLLHIANQCMMYSVSLYPGSLVLKWCLAAVVQFLILGLVVHKVYKLPVK